MTISIYKTNIKMHTQENISIIIYITIYLPLRIKSKEIRKCAKQRQHLKGHKDLKILCRISRIFLGHLCSSVLTFLFFSCFKTGATLWQRKPLLSKVCVMLMICDAGEHSYTDLSHSSVFSLLEVPLCGSDGM